MHGPAKGSVELIEAKRAYAPSNKLYRMVTQKTVDGSVHLPSMPAPLALHRRECVSDLLPDMLKLAFPANSDLPPTILLWKFFCRQK